MNVTVTSVGGTSATLTADQFTYLPANLVVTTAADTPATSYDPTNLSLRTALTLANIAPGATTISFDPKLDGDTLNLTLGELPITDSVTIQGPGSANLKINAGGLSRIFDINDNTTTNINVEIDGLTLTGGGNVNFGGAIDSWENLSLSDVVVTGNSALQGGGGIFVNSAGVMTIQSSTISGNSSASGKGGGLYATTNGGAVTKIIGSTISGNTANMGGGMYAPTWQLGQLTVQNSTISGNSATLMGGGIWANTSYGGTTTIQNSTITGNTADTGSSGTGKGGGLYVAGGTPSIASTIIAGNADKSGVAPDIFGTVAASNSLIGNNTGSGLTEAPVGTPDTNGNLIGGPINGVINPQLGPLANNGGLTQTCALLVGSPAIDMGSNPANLVYDQRGAGYPRGQRPRRHGRVPRMRPRRPRRLSRRSARPRVPRRAEPWSRSPGPTWPARRR